jgi:hypothetical protein
MKTKLFYSILCMKQKIFLRIRKRMHGAAYLLAVGVLAFCCSCKGEQEPPEPEPSIPIPLEGTKWKLAGIVDVKTGALKELEPKNCEKCYTLEFDSDSIAHGKSIANRIGVILYPKTRFGLETLIGDSHNGDAQLFYDSWETIDSYRTKENELRFFYNNKRNYLLYKLIEP